MTHPAPLTPDELQRLRELEAKATPDAWWMPKLADGALIARLRADYPDVTASMDDDAILNYYGASAWKYYDTHDNLKDAREQIEVLADHYLPLHAAAPALLASAERVRELEGLFRDARDEIGEVRTELARKKHEAKAAESTIAALRAELAGAEAVWLIERGQRQNHTPPLWWAAGRVHGEWTGDASVAIRFARKTDAETAGKLMGTHIGIHGEMWEVVQHSFIQGAPSGEEKG